MQDGHFVTLKKLLAFKCWVTGKIVIFCPLKLTTQHFCNLLTLLRLQQNLKREIGVYKAEKKNWNRLKTGKWQLPR